jgi:hypothetical protein
VALHLLINVNTGGSRQLLHLLYTCGALLLTPLCLVQSLSYATLLGQDHHGLTHFFSSFRVQTRHCWDKWLLLCLSFRPQRKVSHCSSCACDPQAEGITSFRNDAFCLHIIFYLHFGRNNRIRTIADKG